MNSICRAVGLVATLIVLSAAIDGSGGLQSSMYRVSLKSASSKSLTVKVVGSTITIGGSGFGSAVNVKATGGGVSTCRTTIEHISGDMEITLSLPIADPRAACRKLPGYAIVRINGKTIYDEEPVKRVSGNDSRLRSSVRKIFGEEEVD